MLSLDKKRKRILLVDDYEDVRNVVTLIFTEYDFVVARDFDEGLALARQGGFDLYILDNWLPGKSGIELCRAIREFDPCTPLLFCSAAAYKTDIEEGLRAGAQLYIVKPFQSAELRQAITQLTSTSPTPTDEPMDNNPGICPPTYLKVEEPKQWR